MRQFNRSQSFFKQGLAVAITAVMMSSANAATDKQEIQQLRQEVEALKALIKDQHQVQQQQQVQLAEVKAQPAKAPTALKSKAGASVDIYGFVRADAEYALKGGNGIFNQINNVDLKGNKANEDKLYATATTSRIGLDFKAPVEGADVGGKVEIDFRGGASSDTVRIRHAYLTYNNWLFGQTTSSFVSTDTQPEMLDFGSPLGIGTFRTPQVRFTDKLDANTRYFVGLEQGSAENRLPTLTGKITHKLDKGLLSARALVQETRAKPATETAYSNEKEFGWGVGLGANFQPAENLILNADYSHVKGDSKYILYTGTNPAYTPDGNDIELNEFNAFTLGATLKINPKLRSTLGYGAIFFDNATGNQNDQLQQGWLNVMYNPVKPITFGAEYVYGERETANDVKGKDSRLGVMAKYDF